MFSIGQRVWHRDGRRSGTVLECEGGRVYLAQDNGAELDFRASDLTAVPPAHAQLTGAQSTGAQSAGVGPGEARASAGRISTAMPSRALTAADVTPDHIRVLGVVPTRTLQAVALLFERRPRAGKFSALDVAAKLNVITEITAVPYRTMHEYSDRPGELGLLMGKGLADSRNSV
jgi:hypothetical protein